MEYYQSYKVDHNNWRYPYSPVVKCFVAYENGSVFLKYEVKERYVRALVTEPNGPVHNDSCVEFFCSPEGNGYYYNFEFNCIGTIHLAYGNGRHNRQPAPLHVLDKIRVGSSLGDQPFDEKEGDLFWTLEVHIPLSCFFHHKIKTLKDKALAANFYKCGDELTQPHYLSWTPVKTPNPDFHQPEYFGLVSL